MFLRFLFSFVPSLFCKPSTLLITLQYRCYRFAVLQTGTGRIDGSYGSGGNRDPISSHGTESGGITTLYGMWGLDLYAQNDERTSSSQLFTK